MPSANSPKLSVGILSREKKGGSTQRLASAFKARGHTPRIMNTLRFGLELFPDQPGLRYQDAPIPELDAVVPRIGVSATLHGTAVLQQIEILGIYTPITASALRASRNKLLALQCFNAAGIAFPPTCFVHRKGDLPGALAQLGDGPVVVKVLQGTQGTGVLLAPGLDVAESMAETLLAAQQPVLLQRFIAESRGRDVRAVVVGGEVVSAVRRVNRTGEFRSNVHRGAVAEPLEIDPVFAEVAVRAAGVLGLELAGVDMLEGRDGPLVMEVNSSPGIFAMEDSTGDDISGAIVRLLESRVSR